MYTISITNILIHILITITLSYGHIFLTVHNDYYLYDLELFVYQKTT